MTDEEIDQHLQAAYGRARHALADAEALNAAGFHGPALVWAERAAEMFMRYYVLATHFMVEGETIERAMRKGYKVLGSGEWERAFARARTWWELTDEPLTTDDRNAWEVWREITKRRGEIIHGNAAATTVSAEEAQTIIAFAERMVTWYSQRFLVSPKLPLWRKFASLLESLPKPDQDDPPAE